MMIELVDNKNVIVERKPDYECRTERAEVGHLIRLNIFDYVIDRWMYGALPKRCIFLRIPKTLCTKNHRRLSIIQSVDIFYRFSSFTKMFCGMAKRSKEKTGKYFCYSFCNAYSTQWIL